MAQADLHPLPGQTPVPTPRCAPPPSPILLTWVTSAEELPPQEASPDTASSDLEVHPPRMHHSTLKPGSYLSPAQEYNLFRVGTMSPFI